MLVLCRYVTDTIQNLRLGMNDFKIGTIYYTASDQCYVCCHYCHKVCFNEMCH